MEEGQPTERKKRKSRVDLVIQAAIINTMLFLIVSSEGRRVMAVLNCTQLASRIAH